MTEPLQIRIPTGHLRQLLSETGALARLESFACEKIAEELTRKAPKHIDDAEAQLLKKLDAMARAIEGRVESAIRSQLAAIGSHYSMPREVREQIAEVAKNVATHAANDLIKVARSDMEVFAKRLSNDLFSKAEKAQDTVEQARERARQAFDAELRQLVRDEARASFIDTLRHVRSETADLF